MSDLNYFVTAVRSAGIPSFPELIELVMPAAQKASAETGLALEFAVVEQAKAVWAEAHQKSKAGFGQNIDFPAYVREKLGKKDSLLSRLLGKKSKLAEAQADLEAYESDVNESREALRSVVAKIEEIGQEIEQATAELSAHTDEAIAESIQEAAKLWAHRHRSERNGSAVDAAIFHAAHADVVNRVLDARLVLLRDELSAAQAKKSELEAHLKALEKQS
jgi:chromosome segregation ATPase